MTLRMRLLLVALAGALGSVYILASNVTSPGGM